VLWTVAHGYSSFYEPGGEIATLVEDALTPKKMAPLATALAEACSAWTEEQLNAFLLIAGYVGQRAFAITFHGGRFTDSNRKGAAQTQQAMALLMRALPAPTHATVTTRLAAWGLSKKSPVKIPLPRAWPRSVGKALEFYRALGLTNAIVKLAPPARSVPAGLPTDLADLYRSHASVGDRIVFPPARLRALHAEMKTWVEGAEPSDEPDPGRVHIRSFSQLRMLVPFGKSSGGDFFLDPNFASRGALPFSVVITTRGARSPSRRVRSGATWRASSRAPSWAAGHKSQRSRSSLSLTAIWSSCLERRGLVDPREGRDAAGAPIRPSRAKSRKRSHIALRTAASRPLVGQREHRRSIAPSRTTFTLTDVPRKPRCRPWVELVPLRALRSRAD
jgi:hypothetical protein